MGKDKTEIKFSIIGTAQVDGVEVDGELFVKAVRRDVRLFVNNKGYLLEEPTNLAGVVIPIDPSSITPVTSLIGYRVRLVSPDEDPEGGTSEPPGCKLINGQWVC